MTTTSKWTERTSRGMCGHCGEPPEPGFKTCVTYRVTRVRHNESSTHELERTKTRCGHCGVRHKVTAACFNTAQPKRHGSKQLTATCSCGMADCEGRYPYSFDAWREKGPQSTCVVKMRADRKRLHALHFVSKREV